MKKEHCPLRPNKEIAEKKTFGYSKTNINDWHVRVSDTRYEQGVTSSNFPRFVNFAEVFESNKLYIYSLESMLRKRSKSWKMKYYLIRKM